MRFSRFLYLILLLQFLPVYAAEPTVQSSNAQIGGITCISANISVSKGNGSWRTILVKQGSAVDANPVDGVKYTAFSAFGSGSQIGTGNYVVYDNVGNSMSLTGLSPGTTYHIAVYEHDGFSPDYLTTAPATASFTTHSLKLDFSFSRTDSCEKTNNVSFTNKSTASFGWITYTWVFRDGNRDTGVNVTHTYMSGGNYAVQLIASPSMGCPNNSFTTPNSVFIVPRPKSNPTVRGWDTAQCLKGNHFYFEDKTTVAAIPRCGKRVMWYLDKDDSTTYPNPDKYYTKAGKYRVFFRSETTYGINSIIYFTGCTDTAAFYIRVIDDPTSGLSVNDSIQCLQGNDFVFGNASSGLVSYKWYFGDGDSAAVQGTSHSYTDTGVYTVIHKAVSKEGCASADTTFAVVKPNTDASFSGLPAFVCENNPPLKLSMVTPGGVFSGGPVSNDTFYCKVPGLYNIKYLINDIYCPDSATANIDVHALPRFTLGPDGSLCNGSTMNLNVTAPGNILWDDGSTSNSRTISTGGDFWAKADDRGCLWGDTISIFLGNSPQVKLPNDTLLCRGGILKMSAYWPQSTYLWSTGQTDSVIYTTSAGTYAVTVTNPCGTASDAVTVTYQGEFCDLFIPDAFTPNGDGKNDVFTIVNRSGTGVLFQIYDRWGAKVFDSRTANSFTWDGKTNGEPCMDGVYQYLYQYQVQAGTRIRRNNIQGSVLLYR